jgi:hypothetical protein
MHRGGKEYKRLVAAFERIFGATMFFGTDTVSRGAKVVHRSRFNFLREATIWYARDTSGPAQSSGFENVIVLSDEFYKEIVAHPIPIDLDAVRLLSSSPATLDLFTWCRTGVSQRRAKKRYRFSAPVAWRGSLVTPSTQDHGGSGKSSRNGFTRFTEYGRSVRHAYLRMD